MIGYHEATGAGGANVWTHDLLRQFYPVDPAEKRKMPAPLQPLPRSMSMRISFRRFSQVGVRAGLPLEDLGVRSDHLHRKTRRNVFEDGIDLYEEAGAILLSMIRSH